MVHGWTVRGDVKDEKVKRDVEKAIHLCKDYFSKFQWKYWYESDFYLFWFNNLDFIKKNK